MRHFVVLPCLLVSCSALATSSSSCWEVAAQRYGLTPLELAAHACVESRLNPAAINRSHEATTGSVDLGLMQINSSHLPRLAPYGITRDRLLAEPCTNLMVGASILAEAKARHGDNWTATGAYNAACTRLKGAACAQARAGYAWRVYRAMQRLTAFGRC